MVIAEPTDISNESGRTERDRDAYHTATLDIFQLNALQNPRRLETEHLIDPETRENKAVGRCACLVGVNSVCPPVLGILSCLRRLVQTTHDEKTYVTCKVTNNIRRYPL